MAYVLRRPRDHRPWRHGAVIKEVSDGELSDVDHTVQTLESRRPGGPCHLGG